MDEPVPSLQGSSLQARSLEIDKYQFAWYFLCGSSIFDTLQNIQIRKDQNVSNPAVNTGRVIAFPQFSGVRCLMMPYIQGDPSSVPDAYRAYSRIIESVFLERGKIGFLTIDESMALAGTPHRGARAKHGRALHTEAGIHPCDNKPQWGWGSKKRVTLDRDVRILLANNLNGSCAIWNAEHEDTSIDGDIGHVANLYPYDRAVFMKPGEVHEIGILTPHESMPVETDFPRQFLRIMSSGIHGREDYFTVNPLVSLN